MESNTIIPILNNANTVNLELSNEWSSIGNYSIKATYNYSDNTKRSCGLILTGTSLTNLKGKTLTFKIHAKTGFNNFKLIAFQQTTGNWIELNKIIIVPGETEPSILINVDEAITKLWLRIDYTGPSNNAVIYMDNWSLIET